MHVRVREPLQALSVQAFAQSLIELRCMRLAVPAVVAALVAVDVVVAAAVAALAVVAVAVATAAKVEEVVSSRGVQVEMLEGVLEVG